MRKAAMLLLAAVWASPAFAGEVLINGGFETGDYTGWTTATQPGSAGALFIDSPGTTTPASGYATAPNAGGGSFYSVTDQTGPGAYSLSQLFVVPVGTTALTLSFEMFANNPGGAIAIHPAGLDYTASPNQHARVDLLTSTAGLLSTAPADVIANFFLGADTGSIPNPYTSYSFDLTGQVTPGQSYRIRFAEVDNQFFFNQGVDNVSILALSGAIPEPSTWAMMLLGFGVVGAAMRGRHAGASAKRVRYNLA